MSEKVTESAQTEIQITELIALLAKASGTIEYLSDGLTNLTEGDSDPHDNKEDKALVKDIDAAIARFRSQGARP